MPGPSENRGEYVEYDKSTRTTRTRGPNGEYQSQSNNAYSSRAGSGGSGSGGGGSYDDSSAPPEDMEPENENGDYPAESGEKKKKKKRWSKGNQTSKDDIKKGKKDENDENVKQLPPMMLPPVPLYQNCCGCCCCCTCCCCYPKGPTTRIFCVPRGSKCCEIPKVKPHQCCHHHHHCHHGGGGGGGGGCCPGGGGGGPGNYGDSSSGGGGGGRNNCCDQQNQCPTPAQSSGYSGGPREGGGGYSVRGPREGGGGYSLGPREGGGYSGGPSEGGGGYSGGPREGGGGPDTYEPILLQRLHQPQTQQCSQQPPPRQSCPPPSSPRIQYPPPRPTFCPAPPTSPPPMPPPPSSPPKTCAPTVRIVSGPPMSPCIRKPEDCKAPPFYYPKYKDCKLGPVFGRPGRPTKSEVFGRPLPGACCNGKLASPAPCPCPSPLTITSGGNSACYKLETTSRQSPWDSKVSLGPPQPPEDKNSDSQSSLGPPASPDKLSQSQTSLEDQAGADYTGNDYENEIGLSDEYYFDDDDKDNENEDYTGQYTGEYENYEDFSAGEYENSENEFPAGQKYIVSASASISRVSLGPPRTRPPSAPSVMSVKPEKCLQISPEKLPIPGPPRPPKQASIPPPVEVATSPAPLPHRPKSRPKSVNSIQSEAESIVFSATHLPTPENSINIVNSAYSTYYNSPSCSPRPPSTPRWLPRVAYLKRTKRTPLTPIQRVRIKNPYFRKGGPMYYTPPEHYRLPVSSGCSRAGPCSRASIKPAFNPNILFPRNMSSGGGYGCCSCTPPPSPSCCEKHEIKCVKKDKFWPCSRCKPKGCCDNQQTDDCQNNCGPCGNFSGPSCGHRTWF